MKRRHRSRPTLLLMAAGVAMSMFVPAVAARAGTLPAPGDLHTSPVTACPAKSPTIIGRGDVTLYAGIPGSLGPGNYQASFAVTDPSTSASVDQGAVASSAGSDAVFVVRQNVLDAAAAGTVTKFSWNVTLSNGTGTSSASGACSFYYDPTYPGAPTITQTVNSYTLGDPVQFRITHATSGATPASYQYQVNGAAYRTAVADSSGDATITVTPTSRSNRLSVTALSPGGNPSASAAFDFGAVSPPPAADGDLTGDGIPDLVTVGGTVGISPGLWLAPGQAVASGNTGTGQVLTPAVDVGADGNSSFGDNLPTDFNGAQVITGRFFGEGPQDYLVYYPSGNFAGEGVVLAGSGHGSFLTPDSSNGTAAIDPATFLYTDPYGDIPLQVANGYNADPNDNPAVPDLLTVSGDPANGYYLEYYQNAGEPGSWLASVPLLSTGTPDGTMDWSDWQISTMQDASGGVDMFLYNAATGALDLWTDFTVDDADATASYTPYLISSDWHPGTILTLRAADIDGDGTPDLWTVSPAGVVTSWLVTGLGGTPGIASHDSAPLLTPTHNWRLDSDSAQGTADEGSGTQLQLSATGGVTSQSSDQFPSAVTFDGSTAALSTAAPAINATGSFSVSAWADPSSLSGTVLSESDTANPALAIWLSNGRWQAGITSKSSKNPVWITATAGNSYDAKQNTWTHVVVTYDAFAKVLTLYLNGTKAASVATSTVWTPGAGTFTLGALLTGGALGKYFGGKIADVQVWDGTALTAAEAATFTG